ncbi:hypothetical protein ACFL3H_09160 [Gemmatimonadota bacterium]
MTAIALRVTPSPGSIILNQIRALLMNHKWELFFMGMVTVLGHLSTWNAAREDQFIRNLLLFDADGALSFPMQFIFVLFGGFWAFRIWEGLHSGERTVFLSYPAGRTKHQLLRITAGVIIFLCVIIFFWLLGATVTEIIAPGFSWFSAPQYSGFGWLISLFGILNAYLYATILSLIFRRPEIWFLFWIPISISLFMWGISRTGIDWLIDILKGILGWPLGVMGGFGFHSSRSGELLGPYNQNPDLGVVLIWTAIFTIGLYLVARIHREN